MRIASSTEPDSMAQQASAWYGSLPKATRWIFTLCVCLFVVGVLVGFDDWGVVCMAPIFFVRHYQVYRGFTSVVFHGGLLHVAFNMMAFVPLGGSLERTVGTVQFLHTVLLFCAVASVLHTSIAYAVAATPVLGLPYEIKRCSIGLSGVIFGLIVVDTRTSGARDRSIFGFFRVQASLYPWVLLVLFQVLMPNVSFLGHLSGLLTGLMYVHGLLNWVQLAPRTVAFVEAKWAQAMPALVDSRTFIMHPGTPLSSLYENSSLGGGGAAASGHALPWANPSSTAAPSTFGRIGNMFMGRGGTEAFSGRGHRLGGTSGDGEGGEGRPAAPAHGPTIAKLPDVATCSGKGNGKPGRPAPVYGVGPSITLGDPTPAGSSSAASTTTGGGGTSHSNAKGKQPKMLVYISPEHVQQLVDMGFEKGLAEKALEASEDDVAIAIEILT